MTPEVAKVFDRAIRGLESEPASERICVWAGLSQLIPETDELGHIARAGLLCAREEARHQTSFISALERTLRA